MNDVYYYLIHADNGIDENDPKGHDWQMDYGKHGVLVKKDVSNLVQSVLFI